MRLALVLLASFLLSGAAPKQLFQMAPAEVDRFIESMHSAEPELRKRITTIGRRNIGQPYMLNLLGEFPYQLHDSLPMFSLEKSDCVVFVEHTYAMALSRSWEEFFWMLQRIRYKDGIIGVASRNHYTEVDWNFNNGWLVSDVTAALAGPDVLTYDMTVDRSSFLRTTHKTMHEVPVQTSRETYMSRQTFMKILPQLQDGDMLNVVSVRDGKHGVSHVGLIAIDEHGQRNFLNAAEPQVREESFDQFFARYAEREARNMRDRRNGLKLAGFKVLRLKEHITVPPALPQPRPGHLSPR